MSTSTHGVLQKDDNGYPVAGGVSSIDSTIVLNAKIDPITGRLLVDNSGVAGFTLLPATGTINGNNTAFTFTQKPIYIVSDGAWYRENVGWTWNAGTLTATMIIPPNNDIWGFV